MAATSDYFFYTTMFQCFVLCIDNELNIYNKCDPCKFITKQTIISDYFLKYVRVQLLVTQKHIVSINCGFKALHVMWVDNYYYCFQTQCLITCLNRDINHLFVYKHIFLR